MINLSNFSSIYIANWKLNGNIDFLNQYFQKLSLSSNNCVIICPPSIYLNNITINHKNLFLGCQDVSSYQEGAYTGELSAKMLADNKIQFCLVGHSERREYFNESNKSVSSKSFNLINNGVMPIVCIGETLKEKENNLTEEILRKQIEESIPDISDFNNTIIAYEPIWAIGTGLTPSLKDIAGVHEFIKNHDKRYNNFSVLYGGSVKATNSIDITNLESVDGCLIGGASLKVDEFNSIIS